jgi:predicted AlkP superfamily pyrophosphatase or phosphodiesterase
MRRLLFATTCAAVLVTMPVARPAAQDGQPRLLVLLVVDQMRADYLTLFASRWRAGFRTLLTRGAQFEAEYPYWNTVTCAGHASMATGLLPRSHGMVLNRWWDRAERRVLSCTDDATATAVPYQRSATLGGSGTRLLATTVADELRAQRPGARVVALSLKPRSAIGMAGHGGDAVVWFDEATRSFTTSRAFAPSPVPEVQAFIDAQPFERDESRVWNLAAAPDSYRFADLVPGERPGAGWTTIFPHPLAGRESADRMFGDRWQRSPFADDYLARLAVHLVDRWRLGQRDTTDFLGVSFSALDMIGHDFGPRSREVEDALVQLDATIGRLLEHLDRSVGAGRYLLALSADHGVAAIPEQVGAGRIANEDLGALVERTLVASWGTRPARYVDAAVGGQLYLAEGVFERLRSSPAALHAVDRALLDVPGLARVVRRDELDHRDAEVRAIAKSYLASRSGDLMVIPRRDWIIETRGDDDATTHGTAYEYDRRVPLVLVGAGVTPGRRSSPATPLDIGATFADAAGLRFPNRDGRSLLR